MTGNHGTPQARLVSHLEIPGPNHCWRWTGGTTSGGYGIMQYIDSRAVVHRVAYEVFVGPIPDGMDVDHECHNIAVSNGECFGGPSCTHRRCCNPWHLVPRTRTDNLDGGVSSWVNTETCANGHLNSEYRRRSPSGQTYCQKCRSDYKKANRERSNMLDRERYHIRKVKRAE